MKRLIAFALVLVMALSMMVMTASAALPAEATCILHPVNKHFKSAGSSWFSDDLDPCWKYDGMLYYDGDTQGFSFSEFERYFAQGHVPQDNTDAGNWWYWDSDTNRWYRCTGNHGPQPTAQPKTGVMDTLPLWFGVMAVSACAYVLTSKKKVF